MIENRLRIIAYEPKYREDFERLNLEWLEKNFSVEENDKNQLQHPEEAFIQTGGFIFIALLDDEAVGTAALHKESDHYFELAKMSVTEKAKGKGIGEALAKAAIVKAKAAGAKKIFLLTNRKLAPAVQLYQKLGFKEVLLDDSKGYSRCNLKMELSI
jgi:N-acetylglutamate synthase-like GNAT family acetyltransferase